MIAILTLASHPGTPESLHVQGTSAIAMLKDVKCMMKAWRQGCSNGPLEYPANPADFKIMAPQIYNRVYMHQPPIPCPLDQLALDQLCESLPTRNTHAAVNMDMKIYRGPTRDQPLQAMLSAMVQQCVSAAAGASSASAVPGLQIFTKPNPTARSSPSSSELGLEDAVGEGSSPTACSLSLLKLEDAVKETPSPIAKKDTPAKPETLSPAS